MALKKTTQLPGGFVAEYWKISDIAIDYLSGTTIVTVLLYKDKDYRLNNPNGIVSRQAHSFDDFEIAGADLRDTGYARLKELEEFADAVDA